MAAAVSGMLWPRPVTAHVYEASGRLTGLLHIDPDDEHIVAGHSNTLVLSIADPDAKFSFASCDCVLTVGAIGRPGVELGFAGIKNTNIAIFAPYAFASSGHYQVSLYGKDFTLNFPVAVEHSAAERLDGLVTNVSLGLIIIGLLGALGYQKRTRRSA